MARLSSRRIDFAFSISPKSCVLFFFLLFFLPTSINSQEQSCVPLNAIYFLQNENTFICRRVMLPKGFEAFIIAKTRKSRIRKETGYRHFAFFAFVARNYFTQIKKNRNSRNSSAFEGNLLVSCLLKSCRDSARLFFKTVCSWNQSRSAADGCHHISIPLLEACITSWNVTRKFGVSKCVSPTVAPSNLARQNAGKGPPGTKAHFEGF